MLCENFEIMSFFGLANMISVVFVIPPAFPWSFPYGYDESEHLVRVAHFNGAATFRAYDNAGNLSDTLGKQVTR